MKKNMLNINKDLMAFYLEKGVSLDYEPASKSSFYCNDKLLLDFKLAPYKALFYFGFETARDEMSISLSFLHSITCRFVKSLSQNPDIEFTRTAPPLDIGGQLEILHSVPFVIGIEHINIDWIKNFWDDLSEAFESEIQKFDGTVAEFLTTYNSEMIIAERVFFHLVENKSDDYPFAFLATYSTGNANGKNVDHLPLKNALLEFQGQTEQLLKLLSAVSKAADKSDFISELIESGELFSPLKFTSDEAYTFLKEIPIYEVSGIMCRIPDWWRKKTNSLKLSVSVGDKAPASIGMDAILSFQPEIYFGDEKITKEEIQALLTQTAGLSFLKGKWVEVDHEKLNAVLEAYEKAEELSEESGCTLAEAMRLQVNISEKLGVDDKDVGVSVSNGEWLNNVRTRLLNPSEIENISVGDDFKAALRHYQQIGFDWLAAMKNLGFGALLADDMGLGKTIQILALLEYMRTNSNFKALLIIPASLIGNWQKETEKFAPKLKYRILHGKNIEWNMDEANIFITTYGMAVRLEGLKNCKWDLLILDEAQAIKNPGTKQTKSVKQIPASFKIAMTGTPIENRLSDLWSLFDFLNTGLLGTAKEFTEISKKLQNSEDYSKLRGIVSPFILRRLKTDKSVISDLPDKIETKAYAGLTKKQVILYNGLVKELSHKLGEAEGIERKGLVLASIMKFKQICNHPDQYLGQTVFSTEHSGKFEKLAEICETIRENRERVLIFTQFKEMTKPISEYLETVFERKGLILHGGTSVKKRTELVETFCGDEYIPFMVLSLKAGGVGLNLTRANHVIHFDRWWNPAVENQATDRAFRIGQTKNVMVHKFITTGTIEEKIDLMIEDKQKLAEDIIASSGENWITKMNNDELINLFTLEL